MDGATGKVLFARHPHDRRPPASTTKIAACTVLLQHGRLQDIVTAPPGIEQEPEISLHLKSGEQLTLEDLLYAMMLRSANDTPVAGAYYLTGSTERFVDMMNRVAVKAGCRDTHFVTPNGLYDPNHYSTAFDLAMLARYAFSASPEFQTIVSTQTYVINRSINKRDVFVKNTAATFLRTFPGADGVKTGYLRQAGHCFVASATRGGMRLIAVVLNSPTCREDCEAMLSYGFDHYRAKNIIKAGANVGSVAIGSGMGAASVKTVLKLSDIIPINVAAEPASYSEIVAPAKDLPAGDIRAGEVVGSVTLLKNGKPVMTSDVVAEKAVRETLINKAGIALGMRIGSTQGIIVANVCGGFVVIVIASLLYKTIYARTNTKNNRRRRTRVQTNG